MGDKSKISWTDATWNPITGCTRVSEGCRHCYAEQLSATRLKESPRYQGLAIMTPAGPRWTGKIKLHHELLVQPLHWKKPRRIFVNSMSDLFHIEVPWGFIDQIFAVMAACPQHTFQILTKRGVGMNLWYEMAERRVRNTVIPGTRGREGTDGHHVSMPRWPLPNVWLGVSVENQENCGRISQLLKTAAAVRFVSFEPLLGPIEMRYRWLPAAGDATGAIDWVIVGGESGNAARPFDLAWAESIRDQCRGRCAFFFKQAGSRPEITTAAGVAPVELKSRSGSDPEEWPDDLRIQEFPRQMAEVETLGPGAEAHR